MDNRDFERLLFSSAGLAAKKLVSIFRCRGKVRLCFVSVSSKKLGYTPATINENWKIRRLSAKKLGYNSNVSKGIIGNAKITRSKKSVGVCSG